MKPTPATTTITPRPNAIVPGRHYVGMYPKLDTSNPANPRMMMCVFRLTPRDDEPRFIGTPEEAGAVADALNLVNLGEAFPT